VQSYEQQKQRKSAGSVGPALYRGRNVWRLVFLRHLINLLLSIDKQVAASMVVASGTVLAAVGVALYSQRRTKEREIAEAHRPQKIEIYKSFMLTISEVLKRTKDKEADNSSEAFAKDYFEFFVSFTRDLIVWGNPSVIKAYDNFRRGSSSEAGVLLLLDDILREIRKDLGNSNWGIKRGDLVKLFLSDPERLEERITTK